jgi:hypothetical protein
MPKKIIVIGEYKTNNDLNVTASFQKKKKMAQATHCSLERVSFN